MADLTTNYLGLELRNPIVVGSSGLTDSVDNIMRLEHGGAGAVVLKSIFEEEILFEAEQVSSEMMQKHYLRETYDYIDSHIKGKNIGEYLRLIRSAKKEASIPIIASVNCVTPHEWTFFAQRIEESGADALEINFFILPSDVNKTGAEIENVYFDVIEKVKKEVSIPISLKISFYFSNLGSMIQRLSKSGVAGLVLFNRFYNPDIDIDNFETLSTNVLSSPSDLSMSLRWIALMSSRVECDLACSTGVHSGKAAIKQLLAGAKAVQMTSAIYKHGPDYLGTVVKEIESWMDGKGYKNIDQFRGKMSRDKADNPAVYERVQFMKYFSGIK